MATTIVWSDKKEDEAERWWEAKKKELMNGISETLANGKADKEVLALMLDLVKTAKIKSSMSAFYDDVEGQGGK